MKESDRQPRLLLLAGSREARLVSEEVARRLPSVEVIASLAGATRAPRAIARQTRIGGFGGAAGFHRFLDEAGIDVIIDATHPFASRIKPRTARIAAERGLPCLHVIRPPWRPGPGDRWTEVADIPEALSLVGPRETVFAATGRQTLAHFRAFPGRRLWFRQLERPEGAFPWPFGAYHVGRPPFSVEDEIRLFRELGVDRLIVKNAGGPAARPKLDAARALGIPVALVRRPPPPEGPVVETAREAVVWLERTLAAMEAVRP